MEEHAPMMMGMAGAEDIQHMEDTPAYATLRSAGLLTTTYRKRSFEDIFDGVDLMANSSKSNDLVQKCKYGYYCCPIIGCCAYNCTHTEMFVPAGHVGLLMDSQNRYLFAQPGMHNINSMFTNPIGTVALPKNKELRHGNRCILIVEQGYIGVASDNGQPVLFPPGIHVWTSETLNYQEAVSLDQHCIGLGPYTLLTVDEGYAAVTQNNGKQQILAGGYTHLLDHKNWRFEKFLSLKIQTDDLQEIKATSSDNITMLVTSTVTWRIVNPTLAATMAAETMAVGGKKTSEDFPKLRKDVLKQAIASLASFIGGVNYSDSFHMAARAAGMQDKKHQVHQKACGAAMQEPEAELDIKKNLDNPLYDTERMNDAVSHANTTTLSYGVEILSINILSAVPTDAQLTNALACGAVASAQALQAETAARGNAKAMRIDAEASAEKARVEAQGFADAEVIRAKASSEAARVAAEGNKAAADLLATSQVAVDLAKIDKSASVIGPQDKFFFGQEPSYMQNLLLKGPAASGSAGMFG
eukprot:TRINITY_DN11226_c0_g1_i1.p1 TRINITY_DN11226_c0_g1~~TRINITY_DN11226_c0_g1_i1.p1  ORF type:complete len:527 (-),score=124.77 TRINITY_DN11226_c0_g1_i1:243-1823(-)